MRTRQARRHPEGKFTRDYERLPGSPQPFKRIRALLEAAKTAAKARMSALERIQQLFTRGFWNNLLTVLVPKLEKARLAALASGRQEFSEQDAALLKAGKKLMQYKSRGHGWGGMQPRLRVVSRSRYMPHQGERECARRRGDFARARYAAIDAARGLG